ncbi:amino acid permease [Rubripirellula sp.]|nr:amino acid permease [Rubripirellula sp.]MDF1844898.1 amino acid permease [Rubripirellula sp.]
MPATLSEDANLGRGATITDQERHLGLFAATGVGVGAIVGGGILALAGVAFSVTGPSAIVAFALNGLIAMLTALSFAEMASKFPESGGTYTFSRKVLSVEAAFSVGWVVWFASIVAAVLYAIGFGFFGLIFVHDLFEATGRTAPAWASDQRIATGIAVAAIMLLSLHLAIKTGGGGPWANVGKVFVFGVLILGGLWAIARQPISQTTDSLQPFYSAGTLGLIQAMGYSFIALQGFDLIAAVGGEVRNPAKTIPRAMILSLTIALVIYLPLLFVIATVGTSNGESVTAIAQADPEGIIAVAARNFLGSSGYWLVIVAAILSMFTALQANLFAASRIGLAMSRDRTLPSWMSQLTSNRRTPVYSIIATSILVIVLVLALPDVAAAGAASSLIFLITFAIAHWLCILVRRRSGATPPPFRTPFFPAVPILGGSACLGLAVFQGIAVPSAGTIAIVWLSIGGILFLSLFARRARLMDVTTIAAHPELARLRGNTPLVLVPIANPQNARAMIALADTLVPAEVGRVLLHHVVVADHDWNPVADSRPLDRSQEMNRELLYASAELGIRAETLTTVSHSPMQEIARVTRLHRCESVLLGLSEIGPEEQKSALEDLLSQLDVEVLVLRAPKNWLLADTKKILVPVAGRGGHDYLLARLLGSLSRKQKRQVTFLRVVPKATPAADLKRIRRELNRMARDNSAGESDREVICSDDPVGTVATRAGEGGLVILGIQRISPHQKLFGHFTRKIAAQTACPIMVISRRG